MDTGSDGILMPIKMFRMLFPYTKITNLNKSTIKQLALITYNNPCIPQMGVCNVSTINKDIKYWCSSLEMSGNGPALLEMLHCVRLQLLSMNCQTTNDEQKGKQTSNQDKSKTTLLQVQIQKLAGWQVQKQHRKYAINIAMYVRNGVLWRLIFFTGQRWCKTIWGTT